MKSRRETSEDETVDVIGLEPGPKKHKREHKRRKRKHKKTKDGDDDSDLANTSLDSSQSSPRKSAIKLKLKIGGQTMSTKNVNKQEMDKTPSPSHSSGTSPASSSGRLSTGGKDGEKEMYYKPWERGNEPAFKTKKKGDDTSEDEAEWLGALERGELDDSGLVKKSKDRKLMTARQRALIHGDQEAELLALPTGYKDKTTGATEEQKARRKQKADKRREDAIKQKEREKKKTMDRLLKKCDGKRGRGRGRGATVQRVQPPQRIRYLNNSDAITFSIPDGQMFPLHQQTATPPPKTTVCVVSGCMKQKIYNCSQTGSPLCSLACYKKNLSAHGLVKAAT